MYVFNSIKKLKETDASARCKKYERELAERERAC